MIVTHNFNPIGRLRLEAEPQRDLHRAAGTGAGHDAEISRSEGKPRDVVIGVVEQIVKLAAQVKLPALGELEGLFESRVRSHERRTMET